MKRINKDGSFNIFEIIKSQFNLIGFVFVFSINFIFVLLIGCALNSKISTEEIFYCIIFILFIVSLINYNVFLECISFYKKELLKKDLKKISKKQLKKIKQTIFFKRYFS